jgi:hypothetical protein
VDQLTVKTVFAYSFPAISVQYHPEFSAEYIQALAKKFRGDLLSDYVSPTPWTPLLIYPSMRLL